jgi:hypothetical protein
VTDRTDQPPYERVLPGTPGRAYHLLEADAFDASLEVLAVDIHAREHLESFADSPKILSKTPGQSSSEKSVDQRMGPSRKKGRGAGFN